MNYAYPMDETWSTQEIIDVVNFFSLIEQAYEKKSQTYRPPSSISSF